MPRARKKFVCRKKDRGVGLDVFLMGRIGSSRSQAQRLIKNNLVLLNAAPPKRARQVLRENDVVEVICEPTKGKYEHTNYEKFDIKIIEETDEYIVIDKPAGLLVHETGAGEKNTLADWLRDKYPEIQKVGESKLRPGIVHRLDKDASGVMVAAKTQKMFDQLKAQFKERAVEKKYLVLAHGVMEKDMGEINFAIDRGVSGRMSARPKIDRTKLKNVNREQPGKAAITEYLVKARFARFSLLEIKIHTGRTHQIRVHLLAFAHPVVGDNLYFNKKINRKKDKELGRIFLHASELCFLDLSGTKVCYNSGLPRELNDFLEKLN